MLEDLRKTTALASKRVVDEGKASDQKRQQEESERLSDRMGKIREDAKKKAEQGKDFLRIAELDQSSGFWGQPDRIIQPDELPYGDERKLATILKKEGFIIHAGFYNPWNNEMGDPPAGSTYAYWAISWKTHSK